MPHKEAGEEAASASKEPARVRDSEGRAVDSDLHADHPTDTGEGSALVVTEPASKKWPWWPGSSRAAWAGSQNGRMSR